jgi:hypothetical protein
MENIKTRPYKMKYMETNILKRVEAEKRLHFPMESCALDILGNMQGEHRVFTLFEKKKIARGYKDENTSFDILHKYWLNVYHNDNGFTKEDKEAYIELNGTTKNENTCGMNGMGVIHAISRILEQGLVAVTRSLSDRQKCYIGDYKSSDWHSFDEDTDDEDDIIYNKRYGIGSSTMVPISEESYRELNKCKNNALKFLGIAISEGKCKFFWNNEELLSKRTLDIKKAITIDYRLLHDTKKFSKAKSCPVILQILNIDNVREYLRKKGYTKKQTEEKVPEYTQISGRKNNTKLELEFYKQKYTFHEIERGTLICDVLKESDVGRRINKGDMDIGVSVVLNDMYIINPKALIKGLKGRSNGWPWKSVYGGQPVIENHVCKNTEQYGMSSRKDDVECKTKGEHVHYFAKTICYLAFNKEAVDENDLNKNTTADGNTEDTNNERKKSNSSDEESDDTTTIESYHEDDILSKNHVSISNNNNKQKERHAPKIVTKYLYAWTLEKSKDWKNKEGFTTFKCGVTTKHYSERFKKHGRCHPRNKIKPLLVYEFMEDDKNSVETAWFVSIESADRKYRVDSPGTTTSEFFEIPTENAIDFFKKHIDIAMYKCGRRSGEYIDISNTF